jgi:hypothetical protein
MRFWDDKDANGSKLTDGRICLVIRSEENPDMPEIRVYGKDQEEVLDKVAKTAETAQAQIHKMRQQPTVPTTRTTAAAPAANAAVAAAVADLSNPEKAPGAIKTLLKAAGVDVDREQRMQALRAVADMAEKWERNRPDYPKDPRNDQILMNKAALLAGAVHLVKAEHLDAAFEELQRREMFFEPAPGSERETVQPGGSSDSRTVVASSYRRNALRSPEQPPARPAKAESEKEARWRNILDNGTGKALDDAIRNEPGFQEWVNKRLVKTA